VSLPEEDLAARGRSIFERLRQEQDPGDDEGLHVADEAPSTETVTDTGQPEAPVLVGESPEEGDEEPGESLAEEPEGEPQAAPEVRSAPEPVAAAHPDTEPPLVAAQASTEPQPVTTLPAAPPEVGAVPQYEPAPPAHPFEPESVPEPEPEPSSGRDDEPDTEVTPATEPTSAGAEPAGSGASEDDVDPLRFVRALPRILAIANQKGGVGKTTTTVNLGASLAVLGYRVLVVDLDPQGNATTGLGINSRNLDSSIYDVILHDVPLDDCVEASQLRNLFVAPATIDLAGAEIELVPAFSRELRLRRALEDVQSDYDFVLVDCPPSLGLLTVNALSAASEVVVPIQCEYYALEGLGQLLRNVNLVQANLNPKLELSAIVLTMYDGRTKLAEQVAEEVRQHFGDKVCRNVVPRTVRLSEAPSFGQPIIVFDPSSRGALAYRELAREVSGGPPQRTG